MAVWGIGISLVLWNHDTISVIIGAFIWMMNVIMAFREFTYRHLVCSGLVALELHTAITEDDLYTQYYIPHKLGKHIIHGDYDYLLADRYYCILLDRMETENDP